MSYRLQILTANEPADPFDCSDWRIVHFTRKFRGAVDRADYLRCSPATDEYRGATIALQRKLDSNTMFVLDIYEHSGIVCSLHNEGMRCRWDTTRGAGVLLFNASRKVLRALSASQRVDYARDILSRYNDWLNGAVYDIRLFDSADSDEMSPIMDGTYYDTDLNTGFADVNEIVKCNDCVQLSGDAAWLVRYHHVNGTHSGE